jgi:peptide/nickel transport system permease protein
MNGDLAAALGRAWRNPGGRTGIILLATIILLVIILPFFLQDPNVQPCLTCGATPPDGKHLFGTDALNRDVLARVVWGGRISLKIALLSVALAMTLGAVIGLTSGYAGGWVDVVLMRLVDGALAIPRLFVLLLVLAVFTPIPQGIFILVLGTTGWFTVSRIVRGEALRLKHELYVQAAQALGAGGTRVIFRHLLPNATGPLIVAATLGVGDVVLLEAGLSYLGLGLQPPTATWGGMIQESTDLFYTGPWTHLFPGIAIVLTVLAINLLGGALRDAFDPRNA